ncbi:MAG: type II toxin-antitoxin system VapC family toxin [Prevotellaceae bacterium]|jgi:tRNA(fMet)-specific endonuclease VapC|nr:type II toxin-antitoxin system VapC family toxin [Prevotellaceae bacterium]
MKQYLLDTNICIHFMRQKYNIDNCIKEVGWNNCCISEITIAELLYGAERSNNIENNFRLIKAFCQNIRIIPLTNVLKAYAKNKAYLYSKGTPIEDLDLFIGSTATTFNLIMVTEDVRHFQRIPYIKIENWVKRD